ncbi:MAG TPA: type IX secretion system sortase PorU [Rubricoccaceae bacterium]|nr:type IX secretion system sortase PorU [Rubricoccaceae bacterium]
MLRLLRSVAAGLVAVALAAPVAYAQAPVVRQVSADAGGVVYEVEAAWQAPLAEAAARAADAALAPAQALDALVLAATRGYAQTSEHVALPAPVAPVVEVLSAEFDEVPLPDFLRAPADSATLAWHAELRKPAAEVVAVGWERREPAGTLLLRLLQADVERGVLVRYRRLRVAVHFARGPETAARTGASNPHLTVERSVLADGRWFKIPIPREGVYRVDAAYLQGLGLSGVDPSALQVYHNGGAALPALNSDPRPADLVENPVLVRTGAGGAFEALYFYAEEPRGWRWDAADSRWEHHLNPFTQQTYVFLRVDGSGGQRVSTTSFPSFPDAAVQPTVEGRVLVEEERFHLERNGGGSGLEWFGDEMSATRTNAVVLDTIPPALAAGPVRYRTRLVARANPAATFVVRSAGQTLGNVVIPSVQLNSPTDAAARAREATFTVESPGRLALDVTLQGTNGPTGWVDWLEAVFPQAPRADGGYLRFATPGGQAGRFEFALEGFAAAPEVWDLTDRSQIRRLETVADGGRFRVQVEVTDAARPRELVAFEPNGARVVAAPPAAAVANQNLHGVGGYPDYVIVTPPEFRTAADDLASYRSSRDGLETVVVEVGQVFNEFSGGRTDMRAIRDYMKFLYDRAPSGEEAPRYLLLFGDGHYDYRGLGSGGALNNWVPTFQTDDGLGRLTSYTSDDYFGLLDDTEGAWPYLGDDAISPERVDVGIGRFPVRALEEATVVIGKIRRYEDPATYGAWRQRYVFAADDQYPEGAGNFDLHVQNADVVAERTQEVAPQMNLFKVYGPSYPSVITAVGRRRPEAAADLTRALNEGTLVWNYSGHGSPEALSDERMFDIENLHDLENFDRLSLFITATCSFGRYDLVDRQSAGEQLLLYDRGGAVGLFTTVRVVYTSAQPTQFNLGLNLRLADALFAPDAAGLPQRLGDAIRLTKNTGVGAQGNNRKFNLLGDPAMRLGLPQRAVALTRLNTEALPDSLPPEGGPSLRAFERAVVDGEVRGPDGQRDPFFNGEVELTVYDAERFVALPEEIAVYTNGSYRVRNDRIYRGRASVREGAFRAEFIVPRDVSFSGAPGRFSAYARSTGADGGGFSEAFRIATTAGTPLQDTEGPEIRLFLNDTTFVDGGLSGPEPLLIARLFDEHGINTGTSVGHELLLTLDGDPTSAVDIGRFFEGDLDSFRSGTARVPLEGLSPGPHTLRLTAWDVANNASTAELTFFVAEDDALVLRNVYNYPNPTPGATRFLFEHNQAPGTAARVQLRIYTLSGRPVRTFDTDEALPAGVLPGGLVQIAWDGRDDDFDPLATGVYLYRLRVEVERGDGTREVAERIERLAVIR